MNQHSSVDHPARICILPSQILFFSLFLYHSSSDILLHDFLSYASCHILGIEVVQMLGGVVVECACVVELKMFINPSDDSGMPNRTKLFTSLGFGEVPVWALISEEILDVEAALSSDYKDDGEEH